MRCPRAPRWQPQAARYSQKRQGNSRSCQPAGGSPSRTRRRTARHRTDAARWRLRRRRASLDQPAWTRAASHHQCQVARIAVRGRRTSARPLPACLRQCGWVYVERFNRRPSNRGVPGVVRSTALFAGWATAGARSEGGRIFFLVTQTADAQHLAPTAVVVDARSGWVRACRSFRSAICCGSLSAWPARLPPA